MQIVLHRFELILNSQPLGVLNYGDVEHIFTPSHLLFSCKLNVENVRGKFDRNKLTDLSKQMNHINNLLNHFWSRYRSEYVLPFIANTKTFYGKQTVSYLVLAMLLMFTRNHSTNGFYDE